MTNDSKNMNLSPSTRMFLVGLLFLGVVIILLVVSSQGVKAGSTSVFNGRVDTTYSQYDVLTNDSNILVTFTVSDPSWESATGTTSVTFTAPDGQTPAATIDQPTGPGTWLATVTGQDIAYTGGHKINENYTTTFTIKIKNFTNVAQDTAGDWGVISSSVNTKSGSHVLTRRVLEVKDLVFSSYASDNKINTGDTTSYTVKITVKNHGTSTVICPTYTIGGTARSSGTTTFTAVNDSIYQNTVTGETRWYGGSGWENINITTSEVQTFIFTDIKFTKTDEQGEDYTVTGIASNTVCTRSLPYPTYTETMIIVGPLVPVISTSVFKYNASYAPNTLGEYWAGFDNRYDVAADTTDVTYYFNITGTKGITPWNWIEPIDTVWFTAPTITSNVDGLNDSYWLNATSHIAPAGWAYTVYTSNNSIKFSTSSPNTYGLHNNVKSFGVNVTKFHRHITKDSRGESWKVFTNDTSDPVRYQNKNNYTNRVVLRISDITFTPNGANDTDGANSGQTVNISIWVENHGSASITPSVNCKIEDPGISMQGTEVLSGTIATNETKAIKYNSATLGSTGVQNIKAYVTDGTSYMWLNESITLVKQIDLNLTISFVSQNDGPGPSDGTVSTYQTFKVNMTVIDIGRGITSGTGTAVLTLPPGYTLAVGESTSKTYYMGGVATSWNVTAGSSARSAQSITVIMTSRPIDPNTETDAYASKESDTKDISTVARAVLSLQAEIYSPNGTDNYSAADGTVSVSQTFGVRAKVTNAGTATMAGTAKLTIENTSGHYGTVPNAYTAQSFTLNNWVYWNITAPSAKEAESTLRISISTIPDDENTNDDVVCTNTQVNISITTQDKPEFSVTVWISSPVGATDGVVSTYQPFNVTALVSLTNPGNAGLIPNSGNLTLYLGGAYGDLYYNATENLVRPFSANTPITWNITAPTIANATRNLYVNITKNPQDNNTGAENATPYDTSSVSVQTVTRAELTLEMSMITINNDRPGWFMDRNLSSDYTFKIYAWVNKTGTAETNHSVAGQACVSIDFGTSGIANTTNSLVTQDFTESSLTIWEVKTPTITDRVNRTGLITVYISTIEDDENTNVDANTVRGAGNGIDYGQAQINITTAQRAELFVDVSITGPATATDGTVNAGNTFYINATVTNNGRANITGGTGTLQLDLSTTSVTRTSGTAAQSFNLTIPETGYFEVIRWELKAPDTPVDAGNLYVNMTIVPKDENTNAVAYTVNQNSTMPLKTQWQALDVNASFVDKGVQNVSTEQTNTTFMNITFETPGGAYGSLTGDVEITSLNLSITDGSGNALNAVNVFSNLSISGTDGTVYGYADSLTSNKVRFDFATPITVPYGTPKTVNVIGNIITSNLTASGFNITLAKGSGPDNLNTTDVVARDANNQTVVYITSLAGYTFPLATNRTYVQTKTQVNIETPYVSAPNGALDRVVTTNQTFNISVRINNTGQAKITSGTGIATIDLGNSTMVLAGGETANKSFANNETLTWVLNSSSAAPDINYTIYINITVYPNDINTGKNTTVSGTTVVTSTANLSVSTQNPPRLSLSAAITSPVWATDGSVTADDTFTIMANVTNTGQAPVDNSGKLSISLPSGYTLSGGETVAKNLTFTSNGTGTATVTWSVLAPSDESPSSTITVTISTRPIDNNTNGSAVPTYAAVETSAAIILIETQAKANIKLTNEPSANLTNSVLAKDSNNNTHVFWLKSDALYYSKMDKDGIVITKPKSIIIVSNYVGMPAVAVDSSDNVHLVWVNTSTNQLWYMKMNSNGVVSISSKVITSGTSAKSLPKVVAEGATTLHIVWQDYYNNANYTNYSRYDASGNYVSDSMQRLTTSGTSNKPIIAIDGGNDLHIIWEEGTTTTQLNYTKISHTGTEIVASKAITGSGYSRNASIVVDSSNNLHVVWQNSTDGTNYDIYYVKLNGAGDASVTYKSITTGGHSVMPAATKDSDDNINVVWQNDTTGNFEVYFAKLNSGGDILISGRKISINKTGGYSVNPKIIINGKDDSYMAWEDNRTGNYEIYYRTTAIGFAVEITPATFNAATLVPGESTGIYQLTITNMGTVQDTINLSAPDLDSSNVLFNTSSPNKWSISLSRSSLSLNVTESATVSVTITTTTDITQYRGEDWTYNITVRGTSQASSSVTADAIIPVRVLDYPDLNITSITFSESAPKADRPVDDRGAVNITVTIRNDGYIAASNAELTFYDYIDTNGDSVIDESDTPVALSYMWAAADTNSDGVINTSDNASSSDSIYASRISTGAIAKGQSKTFNVIWFVKGNSLGENKIYAVLTNVTTSTNSTANRPSWGDTVTSNNKVSKDIIAFDDTSIIKEGTQTFSITNYAGYQLSGSLVVKGNSIVYITNSTVQLTNPNRFINVLENGTLIIRNSTIRLPYIPLSNNQSHTNYYTTKTGGKMIFRDNAIVILDNVTIERQVYDGRSSGMTTPQYNGQLAVNPSIELSDAVTLTASGNAAWRWNLDSFTATTSITVNFTGVVADIKQLSVSSDITLERSTFTSPTITISNANTKLLNSTITTNAITITSPTVTLYNAVITTNTSVISSTNVSVQLSNIYANVSRITGASVSLSSSRIEIYAPLPGTRDTQPASISIIYNISTPVCYLDKLIFQTAQGGTTDIQLYDFSTGLTSPITTNASTNQQNPAIYDDRIVWEDDSNGNWDVYMYAISTGVTTQVTTDLCNQRNPAIYKNTVVYEDNRTTGSDTDIYMRDVSNLSLDEVAVVVLNGSEQKNPGVYGDRIVWQDNRNNGTWDIYMYIITTGATTRITSNSNNQENPVIYGDKIVWEDDRDGNKEIYMYNISSGETLRITTSTATQQNPKVFGDTIVWEDNRNGNWDIYAYDIARKTERRITTSTGDQKNVAVHGDRIMWEDYRYDDTGTNGTIFFTESPNYLQITSTDISISNTDVYADKIITSADTFTTSVANLFSGDVYIDLGSNGTANIYNSTYHIGNNLTINTTYLDVQYSNIYTGIDTTINLIDVHIGSSIYSATFTAINSTFNQQLNDFKDYNLGLLTSVVVTPIDGTTGRITQRRDVTGSYATVQIYNWLTVYVRDSASNIIDGATINVTLKDRADPRLTLPNSTYLNLNIPDQIADWNGSAMFKCPDYYIKGQGDPQIIGNIEIVAYFNTSATPYPKYNLTQQKENLTGDYTSETKIFNMTTNRVVDPLSFGQEIYHLPTITTTSMLNNNLTSINISLQNQTVIGRLTINGAASDVDIRDIVKYVQVKLSNATYDTGWLNATDTSLNNTLSAWSYTFNTTQLPNGYYTATARTYSGGNTSLTEGIYLETYYQYSALSAINIKVDNHQPSISISYPAYANESLNGNKTIYGNATETDVSDYITVVYVMISNTTSNTGWQVAALLTNDTTRSWSYSWFNDTTVANGQYTIYANAISYSGESSTTASIVIYKNRVPESNITYPVANDTVSGFINVTGNVSDPDSISEIQRLEANIDSSAWANVSYTSGTIFWNITLDTTQYQNGTHNISVRAYDGKAYSPIFTVPATFDNHPPQATISYPASGTHLYNVAEIAGGAWDNDTNDYITAAYIKITNTSGYDSGWLSAVVNASGNTWKYDWNTTPLSRYNSTTSALVVYTLHMYSHSAGKYPSNNSTEVSVNVYIDHLPVCNITSHANNSNVVGLILINGTVNDTDADTIQRVEFKIDNNSWANISFSQGRWNYTWNTTNLSSGTHAVYVKAYDGTYDSVMYSINVNVLTHAPVINITYPQANANVVGTILINGTVNDTVPDTVQTLVLKIDNNSWANISFSQGKWNYTWNTSGASNGTHTIYVKAYDGMYESLYSINVNVLGHAPIINITSPQANANVVGTILINGTVYDPVLESVVQRLELKIDSNSWANISFSQGKWSYTWNTTAVPNGTHTIYVKAYDGMYESIVYSIDLNANNHLPVVDITSPQASETISDFVVIRGNASDVDAGDGINAIYIRVDGEAYVLDWQLVNFTTAQGKTTWNYNWSTTNLPSGWNYSISAYAVSKNWENSTVKSVRVIVNHPPIIAITLPLNQSVVNGNITVSGNVTDVDVGGAGGLVTDVQMKIDSGSWFSIAHPGLNWSTWSYYWQTPTYSNGNHTVSIKAYDALTYSAEYNITVNVQNSRPIAVIKSPASSSVVNGKLQITGNASEADNGDMIKKVEVKIGNASWNTGWLLVNSNVSSFTEWNYTWQTVITNGQALANGQYTVTAKAYSGGDYSASSYLYSQESIVIVEVRNSIPQVAITYPVASQIVNGSLEIRGTAFDNDTQDIIQKVEVLIKNDTWSTNWQSVNISVTANSATWNHTWQTAMVTNGRYTLQARALSGGDYSQSCYGLSSTFEIFMNITNHPPTTTILSPVDNINTNSVSIITITGTSSDADVGDMVKVVQIKTANSTWNSDWINATDTSENGDWSVWAYDWLVLPAFTHTNYTVYVRAYSGNGSKDYNDAYHLYSSTLSTITVYINNLPSCTILTPTTDSTIRGSVKITGAINDTDGDRIQYVEVRLDNSDWVRVTNNPTKGTVLLSNYWEYTSFPTATYADGKYILNGSHTFSARAFDGMGNSNVYTVTVTFDNHIPTVNITSVKDKDIVTGKVTLSGVARDEDYLKGEYLRPDKPADKIANVTIEITSLTTKEVVKTVSSDAGTDRANLTVEDKYGRATWKYDWDTASLIKGDYLLRVWASSNNKERSDEYRIIVTVNHKPTIVLENLPATFQDICPIGGSSEDPDIGDSVQLVQAKIDNGEWVNATDLAVTGEPWSRWTCTVDTSTLTNGDHTLYVRAFDVDEEHGNVSKSNYTVSATIKISNPTPTTSPGSLSGFPDEKNPNATVYGTVTLKGTSAAPPGKTIQKLVIKVDTGGEEWTIIENGTVVEKYASMIRNVTKDSSGNITSVEWVVNWNAANTTEGNHTFSVNTFDGVNWDYMTKQLKVARPLQVQAQDSTMMIILVAVIAVAGSAGGGFAYMRKKKKAAEEESPYLAEGSPELEGETPYRAEGEFEMEEAPYTVETTPTTEGENPYGDDKIEWG
ncbi:MAG: Ig-like domain-containing protein [Thermoplasmata archaeon]